VGVLPAADRARQVVVLGQLALGQHDRRHRQRPAELAQHPAQVQVGHRRVHRRPRDDHRDHDGALQPVAGERVEEELEQAGVGALVRRGGHHQDPRVRHGDLGGGVARAVGELDQGGVVGRQVERGPDGLDDVRADPRRA